jgi:hypothetical protein
MELRFEDLVIGTEAELTRIARFLGVDYDPVMLEIERDTTYRRPDPRAARSWRHDATEREVREMEDRLGSRLVEAGYDPSGFPALEVGPLHRLGLSVDHRVGRMRFRQRRYGIPLWMASLVTRRLLPLQPLRDRAQQAIDRVDERYLK